MTSFSPPPCHLPLDIFYTLPPRISLPLSAFGEGKKRRKKKTEKVRANLISCDGGCVGVDYRPSIRSKPIQTSSCMLHFPPLPSVSSSLTAVSSEAVIQHVVIGAVPVHAAIRLPRFTAVLLERLPPEGGVQCVAYGWGLSSPFSSSVVRPHPRQSPCCLLPPPESAPPPHVCVRVHAIPPPPNHFKCYTQQYAKI